MSDFSHITDVRLKAYLASLSHSQVALRRVTVRLGKHLSKTQKEEPKEGANADVKGLAIKQTNRRLSTCNAEKYLLRQQARATHLVRQFLKGKDYKAAEPQTKPQTYSAAKVVVNFLPESLLSKNYDFLSKFEAWSKLEKGV